MYQRVGAYEGRSTLQEMAKRWTDFDVGWTHSGFGMTSAPICGTYHAEVAQLPGEWAAAMLVLIRPGGYIQPHRDEPARAGLSRFHIVLQTNQRCWNFHDGDWQQLELGGIYTIDPTREHGSLNWGDAMRVHLVIDYDGALASPRALTGGLTL